jgi:hypothetical protein
MRIQKQGPLVIVIICYLVVLCISCDDNFKKYEDQIKTSKLLVERIKQNDTSAIKKMIGIELYYLGMNEQMLVSKIREVHILLQKFELAPKNKYKFIEYPKTDPNLVDIILPLKSEEHSAKDIQIVIKFAKYLGNGKILNFDLIDTNHMIPQTSTPLSLSMPRSL